MKLNTYIDQVLALLRSKTSTYISAILSTNVLVSIMGFLGTLLVLRKVEVAVIGAIYPLISVLHFCNQLGDLGLNNTFIKLAAGSLKENPSRSHALYRSTLYLKSLFALVIFIIGSLFSSHLSELMFKDISYAGPMKVVLFFASLNICSSVLSCYLRIEEKIRRFNIITLVPAAIKFIGLLLVLYYEKYDFQYVLACFLCVPAFSFILSALLANKVFFTVHSDIKGDFKEMFSYSKWVLLSILAVAGIGQADVIMTRSMAGSAELAHLVAGSRLSGILMVVASSLTMIMLPKISSMTSKKELNFLVRKTLFIMGPLIVAFFFIGYLLAPYFIDFFLGEKYFLAISVFKIFLLGFCFDLLITPISLVLYKLNLERNFAFLNLGQFTLNIVGNFYLIPQYGAEGAASMSVIIRAFAVLIIIYLLQKHEVLFSKD